MHIALGSWVKIPAHGGASISSGGDRKMGMHPSDGNSVCEDGFGIWFRVGCVLPCQQIHPGVSGRVALPFTYVVLSRDTKPRAKARKLK